MPRPQRQRDETGAPIKDGKASVEKVEQESSAAPVAEAKKSAAHKAVLLTGLRRGVLVQVPNPDAPEPGRLDGPSKDYGWFSNGTVPTHDQLRVMKRLGWKFEFVEAEVAPMLA
jgi:hypothetical protein